MSHDPTHAKEQAHELIERLPEAQLSGLVQFLETIVNPVTAPLRKAPLEHIKFCMRGPTSDKPALRKAPPEDESISEEEERAVAEARDWLKRHGGKGIPHAKAMRRLRLGVMEIEWTEKALEDMAALDKGIARCRMSG